MNDDYVKDLRAFCDEYLKQNQDCDLIDHGFGSEYGGELTTIKLAAVLSELEQMRAERDEAAPVMPDPRGPEHQRVVTDWHTVSAIAHKSWTDAGYEWDHEHDVEHPDECDLLPYGQECLFDYLTTLFGLDDGELGFGPRQARAHIYGPDMNGDFEEWIEWGKDVDDA